MVVPFAEAPRAAIFCANKNGSTVCEAPRAAIFVPTKMVVPTGIEPVTLGL